MKERAIALLKGPFAQNTRRARYLRLALVLVLSFFTQVGGLFIWVTLCLNADDIGWRHRLKRWFLPLAAYLFGTFALMPKISHLWGRVVLPCSSSFGYPLSARTSLSCLANRRYVKPHVRDTVLEVSKKIDRLYPLVELHYFDAGFPVPRLPLFPNTTHKSGLELDFSFIWKDLSSRKLLPSPSPIGYWGYSQPKTPRECGSPYRFLGVIPVDYRLDLPWFQWFLPNLKIDTKKTKVLLGFFTQHSEVRQVVLEPHLIQTLADNNSKIIPNACDMARHDDHFHIDFN